MNKRNFQMQAISGSLVTKSGIGI